MQSLAVSQITTTPLTLEEDLQLCKRLGCALEIAEKKLSADRSEAHDQLAYIKESGVRITSIQPRTLTVFPSASAPEPQSPEARLENLIASVDLFSQYWKDLPLVSNTGADPQGNESRVWDGCVEHYRTLADHAQKQGMKIALEALGPSLMNRNSILFAYSQAQELAATVDRDGFGLCLDVYNSWQDPGLIASISADKLFLVQLADWRRPRSLHDRRALGDGAIAFLPILRRVVECGYDGDYVLEIFSDSVPDSLWKDASTITEAVETSSLKFNDLAFDIGKGTSGT
ncbi:sugar phosphate isomerase/epimerase family protein [Pseudomonas bohemica]|uniref:sugar phosphate isomerase/epimerase family protein n=1 Tax=Pseudomonas bohemica TaxID=2044872 RepID=UPI000DA5F9A9|nr:sugar phosphate isomerase/epimerase family protein [Pseudomonas bohemica]